MHTPNLALLLLLSFIVLLGCNQPPLSTLETSTQAQEQAVDDKESFEHSTPNFDGIAYVLGCVFAPDSCDSQK